MQSRHRVSITQACGGNIQLRDRQHETRNKNLQTWLKMPRVVYLTAREKQMISSSLGRREPMSDGITRSLHPFHEKQILSSGFPRILPATSLVYRSQQE